MASGGDRALMTRAIELSLASVAAGGGPFGCVIAKDGAIVAEGTNQVTLTNDPTAHAEIVAVRAACRALGDFKLRGCRVFTSCEPCPMCLAGLWWARVDEIIYGNTRADAADIGFDDANVYAELTRPVTARRMRVRQMMRDEALRAFSAWRSKPDRVEY